MDPFLQVAWWIFTGWVDKANYIVFTSPMSSFFLLWFAIVAISLVVSIFVFAILYARRVHSSLQPPYNSNMSGWYNSWQPIYYGYPIQQSYWQQQTFFDPGTRWYLR